MRGERFRQPVRIRGGLSLSRQGRAPTQEDFVLPIGERGIFALADGFGGSGPGQAAARIACESAKAFLEKGAGDRDATLPFILRSYLSLAANVLFNAIVHANRKLMKANRNKALSQRGGASLVAGYLDGDLLALASIGSCEAWLLRRGRGIRIGNPRSLALLTDPFEEAPIEEGRAPLMALGLAEDLEPEILELRVQSGDWLLLHSDGLLPATREALGELQGQGDREPSEVIQELSALFSREDSQDNSTISLVIF